MRRYLSTRGGQVLETASEAVIQGIADDKGLFVPEAIPELPFDLGELAGMDYRSVAKGIIGAFFDDYTEEEIRSCVENAYDSKFAKPEIVPVVKAGRPWMLELYHGRTSAFKDMALSILPYLLTTAVKKTGEEKKICILTATSGDTGKAALAGFADVPGTEIIVFYPVDGVSKVQKLQMVTQEGKNAHVFAIRGNFDDAQTGVKKIFNDDAFAGKLAEAGVRLSSANSINIGRLVPQVAYYVYGYGRLLAEGAIKAGDPVNVCVPTGNFGNILAAYYAGKMGLPIKTYICCSNENKVLTDFIRTGVYDTRREFHLTNSPSMDILVSSNLERLLYHLSGCDGKEIGRLMSELDQKGYYQVSEEIRRGMSCFYGGYCDAEETVETIGNVYDEYGYLMDTHTAVAYKVYENYVKETGDETPTIIASTASPYKFGVSVAKAIGAAAACGASGGSGAAAPAGEVSQGASSSDGSSELDLLDAVAEKTGVPVPAGLAGLRTKEIRHRDVIDKEEMEKAVAGALGL